MSASAPQVVLSRVTKVYGTGEAAVRALRGIDLEIRSGDFVAMMGPSGSGKSTAMNLLGCLDTPTSGTYRYDGADVAALSRDARALLRRHQLGFVFQGFNLLGRTSAQENVELPLVYHGLAAGERRKRAAAALEAVGLAGRESHTPAELSGGQQQRVAIARAIVTEPRLLLADEPTGNLDSEKSREILDLLDGLNRERGLTIALVTHDAAVAARARRVVRFLDGKVENDSAEAAR